MSTFRFILMGVFVLFAILGVLFFAGFAGFGGDEEEIGAVTVWGVIGEEQFTAMVAAFREDGPDLDNVTYIQKDPRTYIADLTNALAADRGPDLFFLRDEDVVQAEDKLQVLPFENYSERRFKDTFIEGGEIFLRADGVLAIPVSVNPIVLYWNRTILSSGGVSQAPRRWEEVLPMAENLTRRDASGNVLTATIPFGEFRNVQHAKELVVSLARQAGTPLVSRTSEGDLSVVGSAKAPSGENSLTAALRFYTEFSNPTKTLYTWNSALNSSRDEFLAGDLALYPGYASELRGLRESNPNLNFDVGVFPQASDESLSTFGSFLGLAVPKGAQNPGGAYRLAFLLSGRDSLAAYAESSGLPPVRRDLLAEIPSDAVRSVFYRSALLSHAWLDPDPGRSNAIFEQTVRDITSGRSRVGEAASTALDALETIFGTSL